MVPEGGLITLDSILEGILSESEESRHDELWRNNNSLIFPIKMEQADSCTEDCLEEAMVSQGQLTLAVSQGQ